MADPRPRLHIGLPDSLSCSSVLNLCLYLFMDMMFHSRLHKAAHVHQHRLRAALLERPCLQLELHSRAMCDQWMHLTEARICMLVVA